MSIEQHIVIDWETLSLDTKNPYVVSLGYTVFDPWGSEIEDRGSWNFALNASAEMLGSKIDPDTLAWWMEQGVEVTQKALNPEEPVFTIEAAVDGLHFLGRQPDITNSWGHGKEFDLSIFNSIYSKLIAPSGSIDKANAFNFRNQMDTRTLFAMAKLNYKEWVASHALGESLHDPEADAIMTAEAIQESYKRLHIAPPCPF